MFSGSGDFEENAGESPGLPLKCPEGLPIRHARKKQCYVDEDCKRGMICCPDAYVKESKICEYPVNGENVKSADMLALLL